MPNARRFALSALLVLGSAVLAGLAATLFTPQYAGARVPPAADLPWPAEISPAERRLPFLALYIDSHCSHCSRAAVLVDSLVRARHLRGILVSNDDLPDAARYRTHLGLHLPVRVDSSAALIHAIGTGSVPTLVLFHADGTRQLIVGFIRDTPYLDALMKFDR